jgi:hypothetical protein
MPEAAAAAAAAQAQAEAVAALAVSGHPIVGYNGLFRRSHEAEPADGSWPRYTSDCDHVSGGFWLFRDVPSGRWVLSCTPGDDPARPDLAELATVLAPAGPVPVGGGGWRHGGGARAAIAVAALASEADWVRPPRPADVDNGEFERQLTARTAALSAASAEAQLAAVSWLRQVLSTETSSPPIAAVVGAGALPALVALLAPDVAVPLQFEAAWALMNVASGAPLSSHGRRQAHSDAAETWNSQG